MHNSHGTSEFPDCGHLVGTDRVGNLRWDRMERSMHFRKTNTEPSVHFRKVNTEPSIHFRKGNTEPTMHFRRDHTKLLSFKMHAKNLHLSVCSNDIHRQVEARTSFRMHSVKACVMPDHTVTLQNYTFKMWHQYIYLSPEHFASVIFSARFSAI